MPYVFSCILPLLLSVYDVLFNQSFYHLLPRGQALALLGVEPVVWQPCIIVSRELLAILVAETKLWWIFVALAVGGADPLHILTTHHPLKNLQIIIAEFNEFQQIDRVVLSNTDVPKLFILIRDQELLVLNLNAHACDVVVVADIVLAFGASRRVPLQEPRVVQCVTCLEHPKQVERLRDFHARCRVHIDLLHLIPSERRSALCVHVHISLSSL